MTIQEIIDTLSALPPAKKKKEAVIDASGETFRITGIKVKGKFVWFEIGEFDDDEIDE